MVKLHASPFGLFNHHHATLWAADFGFRINRRNFPPFGHEFRRRFLSSCSNSVESIGQNEVALAFATLIDVDPTYLGLEQGDHLASRALFHEETFAEFVESKLPRLYLTMDQVGAGRSLFLNIQAANKNPASPAANKMTL